MRAFLDTGPLVARVNKRDPDHDIVIAFLGKMAQGAIPYRMLITTNYIVDETITFLLQSTKRHDVAVEALNLIEQSALIQVEWITPKREERARELFRKMTDKFFSFTDITSFIVMQELQMNAVMTLDHHFEQFGFRSLLPVGQPHQAVNK